MFKCIWIVRLPFSNISARTYCRRKRTSPLPSLEIASAIINLFCCILRKYTFFLILQQPSILRLSAIQPNVCLVFCVILIKMFILLQHSMTILHWLRWHKILVKLDIINGLVDRADVVWAMQNHRSVAFIHIFVNMWIHLSLVLQMAILTFTLINLWLSGGD